MSERPNTVSCEVCGCVSDSAPGWVAYLAPEERAEEPSGVVIVCPPCAERHYGHVAWQEYT